MGGMASQPVATGGTTGTTTPSGPSTPQAGQTFPSSTFVFLRQIPRDKSFVHHLYAYDLVAHTERLISDLDDQDGRGQTIVSGQPSISPDRAWVAFGGVRFRGTADEILHHLGAVWAVPPDGKNFHRLTPPSTVANQVFTCSLANGDSDCPFGETCGTDGKCFFRNLGLETGSPTWSKDARTIFFTWAASWISGTSIRLISDLAAVTDGKLIAVEGIECGVNGPAAVHPSAPRLLLGRFNCTGTSTVDGLHEWSPAPLGETRVLVEKMRSTSDYATGKSPPYDHRGYLTVRVLCLL
jgi:hypothetical protein